MKKMIALVLVVALAGLTACEKKTEPVTVDTTKVDIVKVDSVKVVSAKLDTDTAKAK